MMYRCAHCAEPLSVEAGQVARCSQHPDGGIEWRDDGAWQPLEGDDDVPNGQ